MDALPDLDDIRASQVLCTMDQLHRRIKEDNPYSLGDGSSDHSTGSRWDHIGLAALSEHGILDSRAEPDRVQEGETKDITCSPVVVLPTV